MRVLSVVLLLLFLGVALAAPDEGAVKRGEKVFHYTGEDPEFAEYPSCATCHATVDAKEEAKLKQVGPAATLFGTARREGWRNMKTYDNVGKALQRCAKKWQQRKGGLKGAALTDLVAYLESISPQKKPLPRRKVQKKPKRLKNLTGGDAAQGQTLVARYCTHCHNAGDTAFSFELRQGRKRAAVVADSVRGYDSKGKFKPEPGMSYFTQDRLTDEQLKHIVAFVGK